MQITRNIAYATGLFAIQASEYDLLYTILISRILGNLIKCNLYYDVQYVLKVFLFSETEIWWWCNFRKYSFNYLPIVTIFIADGW